jgi:tetratricopeptide (TPR) repeat protein
MARFVLAAFLAFSLMIPAATARDAALVAQSTAALEAGNFDEAIKLAEAAVKASPDSVEANIALVDALGEWLNRNRSMKALSRAKKMRKAMEKVRTLAPDEVATRESEIQFYLQAPGIAGGDKKKALKLIEELEVIDPQKGLQQRISYYEATKQPEEAQKLYGQYLQAKPGDEGVRLGYGIWLFFQQKQFDEAEAALLPLESSTDTEIRLKATMVRAIMRGNEERDMAKGIELVNIYIAGLEGGAEVQGFPPLDAAYRLRGKMQELSGDADAARSSYEQALSLNPNNKKAKEALEKL